MNRIKKIYQDLNKKTMELLMSKKLNIFIFILFVLFIAGLFWLITKWTPLAGDDWGYALNGEHNNAITMALQFYQSWSGRFFSELWGFFVAPRKWLWNILNPLMFTAIFITSMLLAGKKKTYIVSGLIIITLMLKVSGYLRMETYTWIMGSTYVVPLMFSLIYIYIIEKCVLYKKSIKLDWWLLISSLLGFYIGLAMENIAVVMIMIEISFLGYYYYYYHKLNWFIGVNLIASSISFIILRLSPGSNYRLMTDHYIWNQQSIIEKIINGMPSFIQYSFIENKYVLFSLCIVLIGLIIKKLIETPRLKNFIVSFIGILYFMLVILIIATTNIIATFNLSFMEVFLDTSNMFVWLFWLVFVIIVIALIIILIDNIKSKQKIIFFILIAGASNVAMLLSPIFGSRSSLYFVYFIIIAVVLLYNELNINYGFLVLCISVVLLLLIYRSTQEYIIKYQEVNAIQQERLSIIEYYINNPDIKEIHIPRMPPYSVHGADIEEGDTYHFETFKEYYGLAEDTTIIFEWKDSY